MKTQIVCVRLPVETVQAMKKMKRERGEMIREALYRIFPQIRPKAKKVA